MKTDYETLANKCKTFDDYLNFYTPFIHHVANTYFRPGVDLSDLVQVGRIALYAVWRERPNDHMSMRLNIRRSISASFRQSLSLITEGENLEICRRHTNWRREELQAKQSDSVTPEQVYQ